MTGARSLAVMMIASLLALALAGEALAKRVALVIGNSSYEHAAPLPNPRNDAGDMAQKLESLGFEVVSGVDLDLDGMRGTVRDFIKRLDGAELALFYYAGHGLQVDGVNYMAPIDAQLGSVDDLEFEAMAMDLVVTAMERNTRTNVVFLDACRDNPLAVNLARSMGTRSASVGRGLARLGAGVGTLISLATQPGNVALDGEGRNSPFTAALLKHLGTPGQDISRDLILVRREVLEATGGKQVPWDHSSLTGEVVLQEGAPEPEDPELAFWNSIKDSGNRSYFEAYLQKFPDGVFVSLAQLKLAEIDKAAEEKRRKQYEAIHTVMSGVFEKQEAEKRAAEQAAEEAARAEEARKLSNFGVLQGLLQEQAGRQGAEAAEQDAAPGGTDIYDRLALRDGEGKPDQDSTSIYESLKLRPLEEFSTEELARSTQTELIRVGCLAGGADGIWGKGSERALRDYAGRQGIELAALEPTTDLLDRLKATTARVCPLVCRAGQEEQDGRCVVRKANLPKADEAPKAPPASSPPASTRTAVGGRTCRMCRDKEPSLRGRGFQQLCLSNLDWAREQKRLECQ